MWKYSSKNKTAKYKPAKEEYDKTPEHLLWSIYRRSKSIKLRNYLFSKWQAYASQLAHRYASFRLPPGSTLDENDLRSAAHIGLLSAISSYDSRKGASFKTWCFLRVNGAIIDELRSVQQLPREIARHRRVIREELNKLSNDLKYSPTTEQVEKCITNQLQISLSPLLSTNTFNQCEVYNEETGDRKSVLDFQEDHREKDQTEFYIRHEIEQAVFTILKDKHLSAIFQYYFLGYNMSDIANSLHVSVSKVSTLLVEAKDILRRHLKYKFGDYIPHASK